MANNLTIFAQNLGFMTSEETKETTQEQQNSAENTENKDVTVEVNVNICKENNESSKEKESSETNAEEDSAEKKSWFEKLFQSNPSKLKEQLDELTAKNEELKDKYLRLFADFDNYKKRTAKEKMELFDTAGKDVINAILPTIDDFERANKALENSDDVAALKEGMQLVYHKLLKTLESKGVKAMESNGNEFNADLHEAITEIPAPSEEMKGKVIDTVEKGYYINDKILRYAKVVVGK
jgi:molecular chaperone GrpE